MDESLKLAYEARIKELEGVVQDLEAFAAELEEKSEEDKASWTRQYEEKVFRGILIAKLVAKLGGMVQLGAEDLRNANLKIKENTDGSVELSGG